jgi:hypothetical protein
MAIEAFGDMEKLNFPKHHDVMEFLAPAGIRIAMHVEEREHH